MTHTDEKDILSFGVGRQVIPAETAGRGQHVVLCDSQGLKQVDESQQWRLFSANVLLPSVLVYMVMNVVQNDQIRDLARMAHRFQELSMDESARFGQVLSPHLLVVVRDESGLDSNEDLTRNISAHLEDALSSAAYGEDKALIRRVFQTREAWSLEDLPQSAKRALRSNAAHAPPVKLIDGEAWTASALVVLRQVLAAFDSRQHQLHQGGPEFVAWMRSVVETANNHTHGSLGRLIGHGERLATSRRWRHVLTEGRSVAFIAMLLAAFLLSVGDCLLRWVDRAMWISWIVLCISYVGTSPLVTMHLGSYIAEYCTGLGGPLASLGAAACREASSLSVAMLLAAVLGTLSYPVLARQLRWALGWLPCPHGLRRAGVALVLGAASACLALFQGDDLSVSEGSGQPFEVHGLPVQLGAVAALAASLAVSSIQWLRLVQHNYACARASARGRALHVHVAARMEEVQELEASDAWKDHYQRHRTSDALWRFRRRPTWRHVTVVCQAASLIVWAWLIHPHCDVALVVGGAANMAWLTWQLVSTVGRCCLGTCMDPVATWFNGLEESSSSEEEEVEENQSGTGGASGVFRGTVELSPLRARTRAQLWEAQVIAETDDERRLRRRIEDTRRLADRRVSLR